MMQVLLIVDESDSFKCCCRLVSAAKRLGEVSLLLFSGQNYLTRFGACLTVSRIFWADTRSEALSTETLAETAATLVDQFDVVVASTDTMGRNLLPRLAGRYRQPAITNVTDILFDADTIRVCRQSLVNQVTETLLLPKQTRCFLTLVPCMTASDDDFSSTSAPVITEISIQPSPHPVSICPVATEAGEISLADADLVVGCGLGAKEIDVIPLVAALQKMAPTAVGATRVLVDQGAAPLDSLIGQTGRSLSPDLYLALGLSGASQHLCGISGARTVIAVNKDAQAPVFERADYGFVGDLHDIMKELVNFLEAE